MPIYEKGDVRIHYEEAGSGFPLLIIPGGGLNSTIEFCNEKGPFHTFQEFQGDFRCIAADPSFASIQPSVETSAARAVAGAKAASANGTPSTRAKRSTNQPAL